jgi:hypothetical protein
LASSVPMPLEAPVTRASGRVVLDTVIPLDGARLGARRYRGGDWPPRRDVETCWG